LGKGCMFSGWFGLHVKACHFGADLLRLLCEFQVPVKVVWLVWFGWCFR